MATFGAVDPVLAAGTTVTGPGFFVNIDTTVLNPPGTTGGNNDFIVVENDAIITTSGGRSFFNPATINVGTGATAVYIDDSVLQGSFVNNGTLTGAGTAVIFDNSSRLEGAFTNTGTITGGNDGIAVQNSSQLLGGITNTLGLIEGASNGIRIDTNASVTGGVTNSGSITGGSTGILVTGGSLAGGISNTGTAALISGASGVRLDAGSLSGGLTNGGSIVGTAGAAISVDTGSTWNGALNNSGFVLGGTAGVFIGDSAFAGGISNSGTIEGTVSEGIYIDASTFSGGISNTGTGLILGAGTAILIDADVNFAGGISNAGSIVGAQGIVVGASNIFTGGIDNDGGTILGTTAAAISVEANLFTGGITNSGLIDATVAGPAIDLIGLTFQGGVNNSGSVLVEAGNAINVTNVLFEGGIRNSGLIANGSTVVGDAGIMINLDGDTFLGGIDNTGGQILGEASTAILVDNGVLFSGGITNGGVIESTGAVAIIVNAPLFQGGIHNDSGRITGATSAIQINSATFLGGIENAGTIEGTSVVGINIASTLFDGGIANTGTIQAPSTAILWSGTTFNGGITNGGRIQTTGGTAISLTGANFNGGITNTGTIGAVGTIDATGIAINTATTVAFNGGINNSGLIQGGGTGTVSGTTAILINDGVLFAGGIQNSGTIASGLGGGIGIDVQTPLFTGGIANTGRILSFDTAINVASIDFAGGITNSGTIATSGGEGDIAINLIGTNFTGGINNQAGGVIRGTTAINVANTTFMGGITNAGLIDGLTANGVFVQVTTFEGGVNNSGTIVTGPTAGDTGLAIEATDFAGGITNSGNINAFGDGLDFDITNFSGGINNSGTVTSNTNSGMFIQFTTFNGDFTNSGAILAGTGTAQTGTGVNLGATTFNGNFTNSGVISGGVFSGEGVVLSGTTFSGNVTNSGTITAFGATDAALLLQHTIYGGNVVNSGNISAPGTGIFLDGGTVAGSLTNSGTIDPLIGLNIDGAVLGGIFNSGLILGTDTAIDLGDATAGHTITQTGGLIRGNTLADGTGTVTTALNLDNGFDDTFIGAGGILDGDIIGSGGEGGGGDDFFVTGPFAYLRGTASDMDQLVFTGGVGAFGVIDVDGNGVDDADPFGPTGGASANGGVVVFNANDMHVGDGGFALIGDQATVNLANNLNVIGNGSVGFLLTTDNAIHGLIDAAGDVNFCNSPSPLPSPFTCTPAATPGGNIVAVIDAVSFGAAGGLGVADTLNYEDVILAAGTITNNPIDIDPSTAGVIDIATSSLFFQAHLESDGAIGPDLLEGDIDIVINRLEFGDAALGFGFTFNQQSVGNALEGIWDNGGSFSQQFQNFFALLFSTTSPDDVLFYYDELAGAEHAQLLHTTVGLSSILNNFMQERLDATLLTTTGTQIADAAAAERRYAQALALSGSDASGGPVGYGGSHGLVRGPGGGSVWLRGFGQWANVDADPEAPGFDQDSDGLAGGFDYAVDPNATIGGALSFASTDVDFDVPGSSADVDTWQLGLYGNYGFGNFYADGMLSYAWHDIATNRVLEIPIPGGPFLAVADYDADTWSIAGELGGIWPLGRVMMQPSIGLNYTDASTDGFSETGAGAFDLTVLDSDADAFSSTLALRAFGRWTMGNTPVLPDLKLGWVHNFNADRHSFTAFMAEDSSVLFPIVSSSINEDAFLFSGGVTAGVSGNVEVFVDVNGLYGSDSSTTNASVGGRFTW